MNHLVLTITNLIIHLSMDQQRPKVIEIPKKMEKYLKSERIKRHIAMVPEVELLRRPVRDDYTDAYKAGKEGKCWARYYSCPISVFKFMDW